MLITKLGEVKMVNSYQNKMKEKIPIEITWMKNTHGHDCQHDILEIS